MYSMVGGNSSEEVITVPLAISNSKPISGTLPHTNAGILKVFIIDPPTCLLLARIPAKMSKGVMGDPNQTGELFGIENLFALQAESDIITKLIVKRTEKAEIRYEVADLQVDHNVKRSDEENEEAGENSKVSRAKSVIPPIF